MDVFKSTSAERQKDGIHVVCTTTPSSSAAGRPIDHQSTSVASRESARDLGVYLDSDMSVHKHVTQQVCSCYGVLRQLRSIRLWMRVMGTFCSEPISVSAEFLLDRLCYIVSLFFVNGC